MGRTRRATSVEQLVEQFGRWLPGETDPEDLGNLDLFLTVRRDFCAADPFHWRTGDVAELLLDVFPRKVQSDESLLRTDRASWGSSSTSWRRRVACAAPRCTGSRSSWPRWLRSSPVR